MNHKSPLLIALFFASSLFVGCSLQKKSEVPPQQCHQDFIHDYNQVISGIGATNDLWNSQHSQIPAYLMTDIFILDRSCSTFYSRHAGVTCMADIQQESVQVSVATILSYCDTAKSITKTYGGSDLDIPPPATERRLVTNDEDRFNEEQGTLERPEIVLAPEEIATQNEVVVEQNDELQPLPSETEKTNKKATAETIPPLPSIPEDTELLPLPDSIKIPNGTLPSLGKTSEAPQATETVEVTNSTLLEKTPADQIQIIVIDATKAKDILLTSKAFSEGTVASPESDQISIKFEQGKAFCSLKTTQKSLWQDSLKKGMPLSVKQISEVQDKFRSVTITLENSKTGISLICLKNSKDPFQIGELQKTLQGVLEIR